MTAQRDMMIAGKLLRMEGDLMTDLNNGMVKANSNIREFMALKTSIVQSLAEAQELQGLEQALSQSISGVAGVMGGVTAIGGGVLSEYNAYGLNRDLKAVDEVGVGVNGAGGAAADNIYESAEEVRDAWGPSMARASLLMQAFPQFFKGAGELASSPLTADAAARQADASRAQAIGDAATAGRDTTSGVVQNMQGFFGQVAGLSEKALQYLVALAQAH